MLLHDREMNRVAGRQTPATQDDDFGSINRTTVDGEHLVDQTQESIEGRLDGVTAIDCHIAMQDLLQDLEHP